MSKMQGPASLQYAQVAAEKRVVVCRPTAPHRTGGHIGPGFDAPRVKRRLHRSWSAPPRASSAARWRSAGQDADRSCPRRTPRPASGRSGAGGGTRMYARRAIASNPRGRLAEAGSAVGGSSTTPSAAIRRYGNSSSCRAKRRSGVFLCAVSKWVFLCWNTRPRVSPPAEIVTGGRRAPRAGRRSSVEQVFT